MKAVNFIAAFCICIFFHGNATSQVPIDSLIGEVNRVETEKQLSELLGISKRLVYNNPDTALLFTRVVLLRSKELESGSSQSLAHDIIGIYFQNRGIFDSAAFHYKSSLKIRRASGDQYGILRSYNNFGVLNRRMGRFDSALYYYNEIIRNKSQSTDSTFVANVYNNIGLVEENQGDADESIQAHLKSLEIRLALNDTRGIAMSYNNLGIAYQRLRDLDRSLSYLRKSLAYKKQLDNLRLLASGHMNLANSFYFLNLFDSALMHYETSLEIFEDLGDEIATASVLNDLAMISKKKNEPERGLAYAMRALEINTALKNPFKQIESYRSVISLLIAKNDIRTAEKLALEAHQIATESKGVENLRMTTKLLADIYERKKNFSLAHHYYKQFSGYKDSLINEEKLRSIALAQEEFDSERREQEITILQKQQQLNKAQLEQRSAQRNILILLVILVVIIAYLVISTFRKKLRIRELVNEKNQELEQMRTHLLTNISHEFRTPLTLIKGPVDHLIGEENGEQKKKLLSVVKQNTDKLDKLISQLLELTDLKTGQLQKELIEKDLFQFLELTISMFSSLAEDRKVDFKYELPSKNVAVLIDANKVETILNNLISNALKFTAEGGRVSVIANLNSDFLSLEISDSGIGINKHEIEKIFNKFYRSDEVTNNYSGMGVGLALTKELVEFLEGTISVESSKDKGTKFLVELPLRFVSHDSLAPTSSDLKQESGDKDLNVILLVEDQDDIRDFLQECLGSHYNYMEARDGKEALEIASKELPDIIISDLMMPRMDGLELCLHLKENDKTSHIPFIMLTAKADPKDKIKGLELGASDYLIKPFAKDELVLKVKNLFEERKRLQTYLKGQMLTEPDQKDISSKEEKFLYQLRSLIQDNIAEPHLSVAFLSQEIAMSRVQLYRKVLALTNLTVSEFIRTVRLKKAAQLLEMNSATVSEIAYEAGFNNLSYFSKSFKDTFGKTPLQYAKSFEETTNSFD